MRHVRSLRCDGRPDGRPVDIGHGLFSSLTASNNHLKQAPDHVPDKLLLLFETLTITNNNNKRVLNDT